MRINNSAPTFGAKFKVDMTDVTTSPALRIVNLKEYLILGGRGRNFSPESTANRKMMLLTTEADSDDFMKELKTIGEKYPTAGEYYPQKEKLVKRYLDEATLVTDEMFKRLGDSVSKILGI